MHHPKLHDMAKKFDKAQKKNNITQNNI